LVAAADTTGQNALHLEHRMLPRLMQWLDQALAGPGAVRRADGDDDVPESLMSDDTLSVTESTITEYSRAIAAFDAKADARS
jgi:hypothetical protein